MANLDDDDDFVESRFTRSNRDYSPDYRKKKEQQQAAIESDFEYYEEPQRARRSKVPIYNIDDYIPPGVLITSESLRSHTKARNNQQSVVESDSITREEALRRINEIAVDTEFETDDDDDNLDLSLDNVVISSSCGETGSRFELEKLTRRLACRAVSAIPAAFSEFENAPAGFFVPDIMNHRERNVNFVNENELKNFDSRINYKIELKRFAKDHNLPDPEFIQPVYIDNNTLGGYSSKLKIGDKTWFTVLGKHQTPDLADNCVSRKALDELKMLAEQQQPDKPENDLISKIIKVGYRPGRCGLRHCSTNSTLFSL